MLITVSTQSRCFKCVMLCFMLNVIMNRLLPRTYLQAINPILYNIMSSKFRDGFKRLALRMCCLSKKPVMRGQSTSSRMYYRSDHRALMKWHINRFMRLIFNLT